MEIDCRKINLFIGEPNAGKSNILEALGLLSWCGNWEGHESLKEYIRFEYMGNLFYDNSTEESVKIEILKRHGAMDSSEVDEVKPVKMELEMPSGNVFTLSKYINGAIVGHVDINNSGNPNSVGSTLGEELKSVKFYRFEKRGQSQGQEMAFLMPPSGSNMYRVVSTSKRLRASVSTFFRDFGFKLMLRTETETFEFLKEIDDVIFNFPYLLLSDTLQRMIFYTVAMESNENATLVLEEPESHAFPSDTHRLGKIIAFDKTNQYFIATHGPYLLLAILEKAPKDDVNVFITYARDYQTKVKCLNDDEISELMTYDPFGNLDYLIGDMDSVVEETEE